MRGSTESKGAEQCFVKRTHTAMELWEMLLSGRRLSSDEGRTAELMCHKGSTDQATETREVALYPSVKSH